GVDLCVLEQPVDHIAVLRHAEDRLQEHDTHPATFSEELKVALQEQELRSLFFEQLAFFEDELAFLVLILAPSVCEVELLKDVLAPHLDLGAIGWIDTHHMPFPEL